MSDVVIDWKWIFVFKSNSITQFCHFSLQFWFCVTYLSLVGMVQSFFTCSVSYWPVHYISLLIKSISPSLCDFLLLFFFFIPELFSSIIKSSAYVKLNARRQARRRNEINLSTASLGISWKGLFIDKYFNRLFSLQQNAFFLKCDHLHILYSVCTSVDCSIHRVLIFIDDGFYRNRLSHIFNKKSFMH